MGKGQKPAFFGFLQSKLKTLNSSWKVGNEALDGDHLFSF